MTPVPSSWLIKLNFIYFWTTEKILLQSKEQRRITGEEQGDVPRDSRASNWLITYFQHTCSSPMESDYNLAARNKALCQWLSFPLESQHTVCNCDHNSLMERYDVCNCDHNSQMERGCYWLPVAQGALPRGWYSSKCSIKWKLHFCNVSFRWQRKQILNLVRTLFIVWVLVHNWRSELFWITIYFFTMCMIYVSYKSAECADKN